jgi:hypothetical protein
LYNAIADRTKFKRYVSVPNTERAVLTLPRQTTAPDFQQKPDDIQESSPELKESEASENGADTNIVDEAAIVVPDSTEEIKPEAAATRLHILVLCSCDCSITSTFCYYIY